LAETEFYKIDPREGTMGGHFRAGRADSFGVTTLSDVDSGRSRLAGGPAGSGISSTGFLRRTSADVLVTLTSAGETTSAISQGGVTAASSGRPLFLTDLRLAAVGELSRGLLCAPPSDAGKSSGANSSLTASWLWITVITWDQWNKFKNGSDENWRFFLLQIHAFIAEKTVCRNYPVFFKNG
jgi:hypothetical protein